ncbi:MAG: 3-oxoacyl-ACP synthase, partial [Acidobacteriota bacterium]
RVVNWEDRSTCVLFGDGAGAVVLGPKNGHDEGLLAHTWGADGRLAELLWQPAGGSRTPASEQSVKDKLHTVHMCGNEVFKHAVKAMQRGVEEVLEQAGVTADDIALFVPHQANIRIMKATADRARIPMDKVYVSIHRFGNVSAASIPMALADAAEEGRVKHGDLVLSAAFGAGFTWAAALYRW